jgi:hypothetical protein
MALRINQIVAYVNRGGLWKIASKTQALLNDCQRYVIKNINTGEILTGVRDKDLMTRDQPHFFDYVAQDC